MFQFKQQKITEVCEPFFKKKRFMNSKNSLLQKSIAIENADHKMHRFLKIFLDFLLKLYENHLFQIEWYCKREKKNNLTLNAVSMFYVET